MPRELSLPPGGPDRGRARRVRVVAEQAPAVSRVLTAIETRDWSRLEDLLDAEVHWTTAIEEDLYGPRAVIDRLTQDPPPAPPAYHELREGRVVRWIDIPG